MATIDSIDLGTIRSERQSKDAGLFQQPLPTLDSDSAILLDLFGMVRNITIDGTFVGTKTQVRTFITSIESIADGNQIGSTFVSSLVTSPASRKVFIQNFEWIASQANESSIDYTLSLIEGAAIT